MRLAAALILGLGLLSVAPIVGAPAHAEYYCSDGFEPSYGGRCIAVASRDEINLYLNDPSQVYDGPVGHRHHRRHRLHSRY